MKRFKSADGEWHDVDSIYEFSRMDGTERLMVCYREKDGYHSTMVSIAKEEAQERIIDV